jgi:hypothetical protein
VTLGEEEDQGLFLEDGRGRFGKRGGLVGVAEWKGYWKEGVHCAGLRRETETVSMRSLIIRRKVWGNLRRT